MPTKNAIKKSALTPTALIAGGAGFIGSHIADALLEKGARVVVLDNFKTGKKSHVEHLVGVDRFALYDVDINAGIPQDIQSVDYVIHIAGLEEYLYSKELIELDSLLTNSLGTKNLLDLAVNSGAKFLLVSSMDVYQGRMSQLELDEYFGHNKMDENKYMLTEAKRYAEALVWEYFKKRTADVRIVRLPEVYGPRMSPDASGNLGRFVKALVESRDITVSGDGDKKEYYLYISDVVSGVIKALFNKNTSGNIYSLVEKSVSELELAYMVKGVADREVDVVFVEKKKAQEISQEMKRPDSFNVKDLKWEPKISLNQGLINTLNWFGYSANTHSFKPAKLIENQEKKNLFSLRDVKDKPQKETVKKPATNFESSEQAINLIQPLRKKSIKLSFPKINIPIFNKLMGSKRVNSVTNFVSSKINIDITFGLLASLVVAIVIFVGIPTFQTYTKVKRGVDSLQKVGVLVGQLNSNGVQSESEKAYKDLYEAKRIFSKLKWVYMLTGKKEGYVSMDKLIGSLAYFSRSAHNISSAVKPMENLWEVVRPDTQNVINTEDFQQAKLDVNSAQNNIQIALADFKYVEVAKLPDLVSQQISLYEQILNRTADTLALAQPILTEIPEILGANGTKKYLILFQNSNEIRPTGGFIGSYGILDFENGKITNLFIDDIYNPDGQIATRNINITPPDPIENFLNEDRLYIRNANWDPDFTKSANTIKDLYYRINGEELDGVIAVDLFFVKRLIKATGPVFLTAYNEEITADNLYERTQYYSEFNYEDGSDQKRSFLTILGSKLLERIFSLPREKLPQLATEVSRSLDERHLMVHFSNSPVNDVLAQRRWDGSLFSTDKDYLNIVNANLGGTKANYYVKNSYKYTVTSQTRDGLLRGILHLEYRHAGQDNAWPGGPYTNYVRVLVQKGSKITSATRKVGEVEENIMDSVITRQVGPYTSFEASIVVNPQQTGILTIGYDLPVDLSLSKASKEYFLHWQKQPGTHDDVFEFVFDKPFGLTVGEKSGNLSSDNGYESAKGAFNEDKEFYVKLQ